MREKRMTVIIGAILIVLILTAFNVPKIFSAEHCSESTSCPRGDLLWCGTWGECDETYCFKEAGEWIYCQCDGAAQVWYCVEEI